MKDGKEVKLALRLDNNRVGAWDWTFNRPKSVSVAKLVGGDGRIDEVETKAELAAMRLIESQVTVKVRKGGAREEKETNNLAWVAFRHPSSRSGDPASHTHYVIFNITFDKNERAFKAVNFRPVDRKAVGALYHKELRKGLNQLGYKTRTVGNSFEIAAFPPEVKALYSQRGNAIKDRAEQFEARTGRKLGNKAAAIHHRPEKPDDKPLERRRKEWTARISPSQLSGLKSIVRKARHAVRRLKQRAKLKKHLSHIRQNMLSQTEVRGNEKGFER